MGKILNRPKTVLRKSRSLAKSRARVVPLNAEQQARLNALQEMFRRKEAEYAAMSDDERHQTDLDWEKFKTSMNEGHSGYRIPYPD